MADNDSALDKTLSLLASADWFTPLLSMVGGVLGWWRHFVIPKPLYPDVHMLMQQKRLPMRNVMLIDDVCAFDADAGSAPLVALLLRQHFGVEFIHPPRWLKHPRRRPRRARSRKRSR